MSRNTDDATDAQFDDDFVHDIRFGPTKVHIHKECGRHVRRESSTTGGSIFTCPHCNESWSDKGLAYYVINTHRINEY